ncbi:transposase [Thermospira aquatica]|uniref:Transposase n=1 Tax=Thermospira aquatica TaxID=2828656 RepID=A0AAX3BEJ3_9SPIR|nr:transposase [Thermospira aquatica]URA10523.1 transposase [Thermospira aquatica]
MDTVTLRDLSLVWGITTEGVRKRLKKFDIKIFDINGRGRGGIVKVVQFTDLDHQTQREILTFKQQDNPVFISNLTDFQRREATKRYKLLSYIQEQGIGHTQIDRIEYILRNIEQIDIKLAQEFKRLPSVRTVERWFELYRRGGYEALAPRWGKRLGQTKLSEEEKKLFTNEYLQPNGPTIRTLWMRYFLYCKKNNIATANVRDNWTTLTFSDGRTLSYFAVYRYLHRIPYPALVAEREGINAFERKCVPTARRDYESISANEVWESDGHTANTFVINDVFEERRGEIVRPHIVFWKDVKARKLMGFAVDVTENTTMIWDALAISIKNNDGYLPEHILIDNGKAYKNKQSLGINEAFEGLYARLGVDKHFAIPYNPNAKPIESFWRTFDNYFSRTLPGYTGKDNKNVPDITREQRKEGKLLKLSEYIEMLEKFVIMFNDMPHTGHGMSGKSPNEIFAEDMVASRRLTEEDIAVIFLKRKEAKVFRDGIRFMGYYYTDNEGKWAEYQGKKVIIAYNPTDFRSLYVLDKRGRALFKATRVEMANFMFDEVNSEEEYRRLNREKKKVREYRKKIAEITGRRLGKTIDTIAVKDQDSIKSIENTSVKLPWDKTNIH